MARKITLKNETKKVIKCFADFFVTIAAVSLVFIAAHFTGFSGGFERAAVFVLIYTVLMMLFLLGFEKYSTLVFNKRETVITLALSGIYSFVGAAVIDIIIFKNLNGILIFFAAFLIHMTAIVFFNMAEQALEKKYGKRKKLLIIEDIKDDDNNERLRRMKYSSLDSFDAWYEELDTGDIEFIKKYAREVIPEYDGVCLLENISNEAMNIMINAINMNGKDLYVVPTMSHMNYSKVSFSRFDDVMVFYMPPYVMRFTQRVIKRIMDLVFSAAALLIAAIPMVLIAVLIKITSPGPVFYSQERLTRNKKVFKIYKFRTMVPDAEKLSGPVFAKKDDPRITKIGKVLRATRLDELPQILNILKGDMSIVGPRPERPFFVEQFEDEITNYSQRFAVKAGLTSLSHVYGRYSTYISDRTRYDLLYIRNYSLLLDIKIILQTTRTIFLKEAAEGSENDGRPLIKEKTGSDVSL